VAEFFTDEQINACIDEPKPLPLELADLTPPLRNTRAGHKEAQYDITGTAGTDYRVIVRQSVHNLFDFSIILAHLSKTTNQVFRLRRYNEKSHEHTNQVERDRFYGFHVHTATQRYQERGLKEDGFAEPTDRYSDLAGALDCLIADCAFIQPAGRPARLF
jgi:hypothetical protein